VNRRCIGFGEPKSAGYPANISVNGGHTMKMQWWHWALIVSLIIAAILSPFASSWPDGLERVAELLGFTARAEGSTTISAPLPDYIFPGITSEGPPV